METAWLVIGALIWLALALPAAYLYALALASVRQPTARPRPAPKTRFAIVVPAHDEEAVIGRTVAALRRMDYPVGLFEVHVVADHCTDGTAAAARAAGAIVHERNEGPRTGKAAALRWAFARILRTDAHAAGGATGHENGTRMHTDKHGEKDSALVCARPRPIFKADGEAATLPCDAVVVFDADTQAAPDFLRLMDARLAAGDRAIQGQHQISNPNDSWYAALAWAMMTVQNRLQNQGRSNLGLSAFNMGDSICLEAGLLAELSWGEGLTEDYDLRFHLLAAGVRIVYEPRAIGRGEAPASWAIARRQRERWLAGTYRSSRQHRGEILRLALSRRTAMLWDALLQAVLPSYSTLTVLAFGAWAVHAAAGLAAGQPAAAAWLWAWAGLAAALLLYPMLGLALARAPARAYLALLSGPAFVLWRTALAVNARWRRRGVTWVRTPRRESLP